MTIRNSRLANMPLHGIYASRCPGDVIVEDSTLRNVNGDMVRVSGSGSAVRRCTLEWDVDNDDPGNVTTGTNGGEYPAGNNGIEIESGFQTYSGADVTDNTFTVLSTENSQGCLMLDGSCGGCTFSGNEYDIQADIPIIYVRAVGDSIHSNVDDAPPTPHDVTIQNETVVTTAGLGSAGTAVIDIAGRDGSTVDGVCVEAADPPDGVRFDGTQSATVSDSTLNVAGTAVVTVNGASVSTSNVSTTGACTLTGGTGTSLGNIVTAGGNVQTAGGNVQTGG
jgi:hypothetical protein